MATRNIDHKDYAHNGLITKIWGTPGWIFNHSVTYGYPINPTPEDKQKYKQYFISLGDVLPCKYCRDSYHKFISSGNTKLTDAVLENRDTLTEWFYNVHEAVNKKLEIEYAVTIQDVDNKYESFRAKCGKSTKTTTGCVAPLDYKAFSFKKLYYDDAPILHYNEIQELIILSIIRNIDTDYKFIELAIKKNGDFKQLKKYDFWLNRNKYCQTQIRFMRENGIPSIEESGKWIGTPTIEELQLIVYLSSNLNKSEIKLAIDNTRQNKYFNDFMNKIS